MPSDTPVNDAILQPFLMAQDIAESQQQLTVLVSEHAEPRMKGAIAAYLGSNFTGREHHVDFDDLCSEAKTRLVTYLHKLKLGRTADPCRDFLGYAVKIAHNACRDYFRQMNPLRARLHKKIRDLLHANQNFAAWTSPNENTVEWLCGFHYWRGQRASPNSTAWIRGFYDNPETATEGLASGGDIQSMEMAYLLAAIFKDVGEPIRLNDVVNVVSDIRRINDVPAASFEDNGARLGSRLPDSKARIDLVLEMRDPLVRYWRWARELPRDAFLVSLLYGRDSAGEDVISLLLDAKVTTKTEVAGLLGMTREQFRDLRFNRLPLDNKEISKELGIKLEQVYKLRRRAGKRLELLLD